MQENTAPAPAANIALLPPAQRAVIVLESTKAEAQLRELVALSTDIVEVKDKDGREQAHRAGMTLKNARVGIEKAGKLARDDANAFSKAVVAEQQRLVDIVTGEETRIFGLRDGYDAKLAAEKAEVERIERERVQGIQSKIECIRSLPHASINDSAAELADTIADLEQLVPGMADFAEFCPNAAAARDTALVLLREMHVGASAREAEAARVAAERAELDKLRAEQAERDRVAAETKRQLDAQQAEIAAARREQEEKAAALEADRIAFAKHQEEAKAAAARASAAQAPANDDVVEQVSADLVDAIEPAASPTLAEVLHAVAPAEIARAITADDAPADSADEEAEAALRGRVACLNLAVSDLLTMGCTADHVRELVDIALADAQKVAA